MASTSLLVAELGPTNTGKTWRVIERMLEHDSGMIGLPLRLLAREVFDWVSARVGEARVALVTGEEKRVRPHPSYCGDAGWPAGRLRRRRRDSALRPSRARARLHEPTLLDVNQMGLFGGAAKAPSKPGVDAVIAALEAFSVDTTTPLEALAAIAKWKQSLKP